MCVTPLVSTSTVSFPKDFEIYSWKCFHCRPDRYRYRSCPSDFPAIPKHCLYLCHVLYDNVYGNLPSSAGSKHLFKVFGQCDIGKFVHHYPYMNRQSAAVSVRLVVKLLKCLRIKHTYDKIQTGIVIGNNGKHRLFPDSDGIQKHFILFRYSCNLGRLKVTCRPPLTPK